MWNYDIKSEVQTPEDGYMALAGAILKKAYQDYKMALISGDKKAIKHAEDWFDSRLFHVITMGEVDPRFLMEQARKEVLHGY